MLTKLAILLFALAFAKAANYELAAPPKLCESTIKVMKGPVVLKTLCFLNFDATQYVASDTCEKRGMRLFQPNTSPEAWNTLVTFGKSRLGGSSKAQVYVSGRKGKQCQVFVGNGKLSYVDCLTPLNTLCEYFDPKPVTTRKVTTPEPRILIECESFGDISSFRYRYYVDTTGIATPQLCNYHKAISSAITAFTLKATDPQKEAILALDMDFTATIEYFPLDLAKTFPNLNAFICEYCDIELIEKKHLSGLTKLQYLALDGNKLTTLDSNVFMEVPRLMRLDLVASPLVSISAGFFSTALPVLVQVYLDGAGCIDTYVDEFDGTRAMVAALPGSVANTCIITA